MSRLFSKIHTSYAPDGISSGAPSISSGGNVAAPVEPKTEAEIFDLLSQDDEPEEEPIIPVSKKKAKGEEDDDSGDDKKARKTGDEKKKVVSEEDEETLSEDDDEDDELEELEEELREPTEEDLELKPLPSRREILKEFPELFKKFPALQSAYYRDQQFSQHFATPEEASHAKERAGLWDSVEEQLGNGDLSQIFKVVNKVKPEAFNTMMDNLFENIRDTNEGAYTHLIGNLSKTIIASMVSESTNSGDKNLRAAAAILNKFLFGTTQYTEPGKLSKEQKEEDPRARQLAEERQNFLKQRFDEAQTSVNSRLENKIRRSIEAVIDPKGSMTEYVRGHAVNESVEKIGELIGKDKRFRVILDRMWDNAHKSGYSKESIEKIEKAYISRAASQLQSVIKTARFKALKGMGIRVREEAINNEQDTKDTSRKSRSDKQEPARSQNREGKKGIPAGMSTEDYFMSDSIRQENTNASS